MPEYWHDRIFTITRKGVWQPCGNNSLEFKSAKSARQVKKHDSLQNAKPAAESDDSVTKVIFAVANSLGYTEIHRLQETAVRAGSNVFLSIPMGSGKSMCYAVLHCVCDMLWAAVLGDSRQYASFFARDYDVMSYANEIRLNHGTLAIVTRRSLSLRMCGPTWQQCNRASAFQMRFTHHFNEVYVKNS